MKQGKRRQKVGNVGRRIVLLDFDGVLNSPATWGRHWEGDGRAALDEDKVARVAALCEACDAHVVISSAWRHSRTLAGLRRLLAARGFRDARRRVIDVTPDLGDAPRGHEIRRWLAGEPDVVAWVVFDDCRDAGEGCWHRFVQTDYRQGITAADIVRAAAHLARHVDDDADEAVA